MGAADGRGAAAGAERPPEERGERERRREEEGGGGGGLQRRPAVTSTLWLPPLPPVATHPASHLLLPALLPAAGRAAPPPSPRESRLQAGPRARGGRHNVVEVTREPLRSPRPPAGLRRARPSCRGRCGRRGQSPARAEARGRGVVGCLGEVGNFLLTSGVGSCGDGEPRGRRPRQVSAGDCAPSCSWPMYEGETGRSRP